jgi:hypothetical protein
MNQSAVQEAALVRRTSNAAAEDAALGRAYQFNLRRASLTPSLVQAEEDLVEVDAEDGDAFVEHKQRNPP